VEHALAAIRAVDSEGQLETVLAMPDHLRDALWRIESGGLERAPASAAIVCGMGGSAIGGDLAAAALGARLTKPLLTVRRYELPAWTSPDSTVLCSSYSGDTEETLACFEAAEALGARRLVATTGGQLAEAARREGVPVIGLPAGLQPRAAVAYMFAVAAEVASLTEAAPRINMEIDRAAARLEAGRDALLERSLEFADAIEDTTPVVHGSDLTEAVAYRWKCEINENAKLPAFSSLLPEANHNELVGWEGASQNGRFSCVFLEDRDQHPRERRRIELTAKLTEPSVERVLRIEVEGETRTERMLELVMLGDLISLHLAARRDRDPSPVEVIERLKSELGE
jgi:glucose/mannose-6-phosphate isomerase